MSQYPHAAGQNLRTNLPVVNSLPLSTQPGYDIPRNTRGIDSVPKKQLVVDSSMSITPARSAPIVPAPIAQLPATIHASAICETAVSGLLALGLPPIFSGAAYAACVKLLPVARRAVGNSTTALTKYLINKVQSKFMAGNKVTRAPRVAAPQRSSAKMAKALANAPGAASLTAPGPMYGRSVAAAPAAYSVRQRGSGRPRVKSSGRGMLISHSEMIGNLVSSGTTLLFSATDFTLNPGKYSTFPWLSTLAGNFDKYIMRKVVVHLVSNQPTSTGGKIGIGFDYDSTDPAPSDRNEFFSLTHHVECAPWDSVSLTIPMDGMPRFVNSHTTSDSKLIDCGQIIFMADQIVAASTALADMIIEYEVELLEPQQAIYSTMNVFAVNPATFADVVISGPVVWTSIPTTSTTVWEFNVPQGYYFFTVSLKDTGGGTPVVGVTVHNCVATGGYGSAAITAGDTTIDNVIGRVYTDKNDAKIKLSLSGVTLANLEMFWVVVTRVSSSVYRATSSAPLTLLNTY